MSYPADGVESAYRNRSDDVASMLNTYHPTHYLIFNLSERQYDAAKFSNSVEHVPFPDHHAPPLPLLLLTCHKIDLWLNKDPENVVVIHCLAGKGRTGTVIAAYLVFSGLFSEADEGMNYYASKRSINNWGVTGPSQRRAVNYLAEVISKNLTPPFDPLFISTITIEGVPRLDGDLQNGIPPPFFVIYNNNDPMNVIKLFDTRYSKQPPCITQETTSLSWEVKKEIQGDILVNFMHSPSKFFGFHDQMLGRFSFYTGMLTGNTITFTQSEIDEANSNTDGRFPPNFKVILEFEPCSQERIAQVEKSEEFRKSYEKEIWKMRSSEPRDGSICFLQSERTQERIAEARDSVSNRGAPGEMGGYLTMRENTGDKQLKRRWFVMKVDRVSYFKGPRHLKSLGDFLAHNISEIQPDTKDAKAFEILHAGQEIQLFASDELNRDQWVRSILKLKQNCFSLPDPSLDLDSLQGSLYLTISTLSLSLIATTYALQLVRKPLNIQDIPPRKSPPQPTHVSVYCEIEFASQKQTTPIFKLVLSGEGKDPSKGIAIQGDDAKWDFKFLVFDLYSSFSIRVYYVPLGQSENSPKSIVGEAPSEYLLVSTTSPLGAFLETNQFNELIKLQDECKLEDEVIAMTHTTSAVRLSLKYLPSVSSLSITKGFNSAKDTRTDDEKLLPDFRSVSSLSSLGYSHFGEDEDRHFFSTPNVPESSHLLDLNQSFPSPSPSPNMNIQKKLSQAPTPSPSFSIEDDLLFASKEDYSPASSPTTSSFSSISPCPSPCASPQFHFLDIEERAERAERAAPTSFQRLETLKSPFVKGNIIFLQSLNSTLNLRIRKISGRVEANGKLQGTSKFIVHTFQKGRITLQSATILKTFVKLKDDGTFTGLGLGDEPGILFHIIPHPKEGVFTLESVVRPGSYLSFDESGIPITTTSLGKPSQLFICVFGKAKE